MTLIFGCFVEMSGVKIHSTFFVRDECKPNNWKAIKIRSEYVFKPYKHCLQYGTTEGQRLLQLSVPITLIRCIFTNIVTFLAQWSQVQLTLSLRVTAVSSATMAFSLNVPSSVFRLTCMHWLADWRKEFQRQVNCCSKIYRLNFK